MGRLQKKKSASPKKDRQKAGDSAPGAIQESRDSSSSTRGDDPGAREAGGKKQKPMLSASGKTSGRISGRSSGDQTFLMKLLDRYFGSWIQYLREVRNELSKVVWPSRKDTSAMTAVVLVFVLIVSFFLGIIDFGLSSLVRIIL
ncbi:MAG: preprotein translocase subunit SecE [Desulfosalsimonadaceae bacterium]